MLGVDGCMGALLVWLRLPQNRDRSAIHSSKGAHISMLFAEGVVAGREFIPDSVAAASEPRIHACLAVSEMSARNNGEEGARMHKSLPSPLIHVSVFLVS